MAEYAHMMSLEEAMRRLREASIEWKQILKEVREISIVQIQIFKEMIGESVTKIDIVEDSHKVPLQSSDVEFVPAEFPKFESGDPTPWLHEAERFIDFYRIEEDRKLEITYFHMKGEAFQWFQRLKRAGQFSSWTQFKQALISRFGSTEFDDSHGDIVHKDSVEDIEIQFEELTNKVQDFPTTFLISSMSTEEGCAADEVEVVLVENQKERASLGDLPPLMSYSALEGQATPKSPIPLSYFLSCAVSGLKPELRKEILMLKPQMINEAFLLATMQEAKSNNGLFYSGDEKFVQGHGCKAKQMLISQSMKKLLVDTYFQVPFMQDEFVPRDEINPAIHQPYVPWGICCLEDDTWEDATAVVYSKCLLANWNDAAVMYSNFPAMNLEDKVELKR